MFQTRPECGSKNYILRNPSPCHPRVLTHLGPKPFLTSYPEGWSLRNRLGKDFCSQPIPSVPCSDWAAQSEPPTEGRSTIRHT